MVETVQPNPLTVHTGPLRYNGYNLTEVSSERVPTLKPSVLREFHSYLNDTDESPFAVLFPTTIDDSDAMIMEDSVAAYDPERIFASIYTKVIEGAMAQKRYEDVHAYTNETLVVGHPLGFFCVYRNGDGTDEFLTDERLLLIVPGALLNEPSVLPKSSTYVFVFNPTSYDDSPLSVFVKKKIRVKEEIRIVDEYADPDQAVDILWYLKEGMDDTRPGAFSKREMTL